MKIERDWCVLRIRRALCIACIVCLACVSKVCLARGTPTTSSSSLSSPSSSSLSSSSWADQDTPSAARADAAKPPQRYVPLYLRRARQLQERKQDYERRMQARMSVLRDASTTFAQQLYLQQVAEQEPPRQDNVVLSPLGAYVNLAMALPAARGLTKRQVLAALNLQGEGRGLHASLRRALTSLLADDSAEDDNGGGGGVDTELVQKGLEGEAGLGPGMGLELSEKDLQDIVNGNSGHLALDRRISYGTGGHQPHPLHYGRAQATASLTDSASQARTQAGGEGSGGRDPGLRMRLAHGMFHGEGLALSQHFSNRQVALFGAPPMALQRQDPEQSVNLWVDAATRGAVPDMLDPGYLERLAPPEGGQRSAQQVQASTAADAAVTMPSARVQHHATAPDRPARLKRQASFSGFARPSEVQLSDHYTRRRGDVLYVEDEQSDQVDKDQVEVNGNEEVVIIRQLGVFDHETSLGGEESSRFLDKKTYDAIAKSEDAVAQNIDLLFTTHLPSSASNYTDSKLPSTDGPLTSEIDKRTASLENFNGSSAMDNSGHRNVTNNNIHNHITGGESKAKRREEDHDRDSPMVTVQNDKQNQDERTTDRTTATDPTSHFPSDPVAVGTPNVTSDSEGADKRSGVATGSPDEPAEATSATTGLGVLPPAASHLVGPTEAAEANSAEWSNATVGPELGEGVEARGWGGQEQEVKEEEGKEEKEEDEDPAASRLLVLISAWLFCGAWLHSLNGGETIPVPFTTGTGQLVSAPFVYNAGNYSLKLFADNYGPAGLNGARVLELPYAEDRYSLFLFLPRRDVMLHELERGLLQTGNLGDLLRDMPIPTPAVILLPRFRLRSRQSLRPALQKMGIKRLFADGRADLGRMTDDDADDGPPPHVSDFVHLAVLDVGNEARTARGSNKAAPARSARVVTQGAWRITKSADITVQKKVPGRHRRSADRTYNGDGDPPSQDGKRIFRPEQSRRPSANTTSHSDPRENAPEKLKRLRRSKQKRADRNQVTGKENPPHEKDKREEFPLTNTKGDKMAIKVRGHSRQEKQSVYDDVKRGVKGQNTTIVKTETRNTNKGSHSKLTSATGSRRDETPHAHAAQSPEAFQTVRSRDASGRHHTPPNYRTKERGTHLHSSAEPGRDGIQKPEKGHFSSRKQLRPDPDEKERANVLDDDFFRQPPRWPQELELADDVVVDGQAKDEFEEDDEFGDGEDEDVDDDDELNEEGSDGDEFVADRPFFFLVLDKRQELVLFMGHVTNPLF